MPIERDRARAKRRHAKRQAALVAKAARRRRNQQVAGAALAVLFVVGGVYGLTRMLDGDPTSAAATPAASSTAANPCAVPTPRPAAAPPSFKAAPPRSLARGKVWDATVKTSCGTIGLQLYGDKAPQTVASFIFLSRNGFYANSPCHRLTATDGLKVLQCGDPTGKGTGSPGYGYGVENVPADGKYPAGTLAMARGSSTTSNGSQFFLTYGDSTLPTKGGGYSVFGRVTKGLGVLNTVAKGGTTNGQPDGKPARATSIESITVTTR